MSARNFEEKLLLRNENERVNDIVLPKLRKKYSYEWEKITDENNAFIWLDSRLDLKKEKIFYGKTISI